MSQNRPQIRKELALLRPQMFLGQLKETEDTTWLVSNQQIIYKQIRFSPAVLTLYNHILINASDVRNGERASIINITVKETGSISILNDGATIPLDWIYCIFGNAPPHPQCPHTGYSVKLVNIFSNTFSVQVGYPELQKAIKVTWKHNMSTLMDADSLPYPDNKPYIKICFSLDLGRFGLKQLSPELIGLMERRASDIAALLHIRVKFNQRSIIYQHISEYVKLYVKNQSLVFTDRDSSSPRWTVFLGKSEHGFQQISFINNCIWTRKGGSHVDFIVSQIAERSLQRFKKRPRTNLQSGKINDELYGDYFIFVSVFLPNANYDNLNQDRLINDYSHFGRGFTLSEEAFNFMEDNKCLQGYRDIAMNHIARKEGRDRNRVRSRVCGNGLQDAYNAGYSNRCKLWIVQNEAMSTLLLSCYWLFDLKYNGVITLSDLPANVRELSAKKFQQNQDYQTIMKALGLATDRLYKSTDELRYSGVVIVANRDQEGTQLKGLLMNFFNGYWPSLCQIQGFIKLLVLPTLRCKHLNGSVRLFMGKQEWKQFMKRIKTSDRKQWSMSSFEDMSELGLSGMQELLLENKENFILDMIFLDDSEEQMLKVVYSRKATDKKKQLLEQFDSAGITFRQRQSISARQFIAKEVMGCEYVKTVRVIPSAIDGLNDIQRKTLLSWIPLAQEHVKMSKLLALLKQNWRIYENQDSIVRNIVRLAQCFVGGNNLPLIRGNQLGSRYYAGKDIPSQEYISAQLAPYTPFLFRKEDLELVSYSKQGEPVCLFPILPLSLINGCREADNLFRVSMLGHRVGEMLDVIRQRLQKYTKPLVPSWQQFKGVVEQQKKGRYKINGNHSVRDNYVKITQIPPYQSLKEYRLFLEEQLGSDQKDGLIQSIQELHKGNNVQFIVKFREGSMPVGEELNQMLMLSAVAHQKGTVLVDESGGLKKFEGVEEVVQRFFQVRIKVYQMRRNFIMQQKYHQFDLVRQKIQFIRMVLDGELKLSQNQSEWLIKLENKGFTRFDDFKVVRPKLKLVEPSDQKPFRHLLQIPIAEMNDRRLRELEREKETIEEQVERLGSTSEKEMWQRDLLQFEDQWLSEEKRKAEQRIEIMKKYVKKQCSELSPQDKHKFERRQASVTSQEIVSSPQSFQKVNLIQNGQSHSKEGHFLKITYPSFLNRHLRRGRGSTIQTFQGQLRSMQNSSIVKQQQKNKVKRELQMQEKLKKREVEQARRKARKAKSKESNGQQHPKPSKPNSIATRQKMYNDVGDIFRRHEAELKRKQEQQENRSKSDREHLPKDNDSQQKPKVAMPFIYHGFEVNQVQRKRFSSRAFIIDPVQVQNLEQQLKDEERREDERERNRINNVMECINLDDD